MFPKPLVFQFDMFVCYRYHIEWANIKSCINIEWSKVVWFCAVIHNILYNCISCHNSSWSPLQMPDLRKENMRSLLPYFNLGRKRTSHVLLYF